MGQVQPTGQFSNSNLEPCKTAMQHWAVPAPPLRFLICRVLPVVHMGGILKLSGFGIW